MTDVTGFGILGHALEMAQGSNMRISLRAGDIALLPRCAELAEQAFVTGASHRNWASYGTKVLLPEALPLWRRHILTDPQTPGGLLVSCNPDRENEFLQEIIAAGYPAARIIGVVEPGEPGLRVTA